MTLKQRHFAYMKPNSGNGVFANKVNNKMLFHLRTYARMCMRATVGRFSGKLVFKYSLEYIQRLLEPAVSSNAYRYSALVQVCWMNRQIPRH